MGRTMGAGVRTVSSVGRDPCFPAGTPVLMADGTTRPIEDVAVGDHVACTDPDTGQPTTSTVTRTFTHEHTPTIRLATSNGDLETTPAHPLYVHGKGFTPAGHIQSGDRLRDNHGPLYLHWEKSCILLLPLLLLAVVECGSSGFTMLHLSATGSRSKRLWLSASLCQRV